MTPYIPQWSKNADEPTNYKRWQLITESEIRSRLSEPGYIDELVPGKPHYNIKRPGFIGRILPHKEWYFETITAIIALIDHDAYPATKDYAAEGPRNIVPGQWAKNTINEMVYYLLIIREYHRTKKEFKESDSIRSRLGDLNIEVQDRDHKDEGVSLIHPVWGKYVAWELPPFMYSGYWKRSAYEIHGEKERSLQPQRFVDGEGI